MLKSSGFVLLILFFGCSSINENSKETTTSQIQNIPLSPEGWSLVWSDEFEGTEINKDWWNYNIGNGKNGWGNNELEYYTDTFENSRVENGNLVIEARNDLSGDYKYSSARLTTKNKKSFGFGRTDIRAKIPLGQGIWPALWMLGDNINEVGWPACGEIDIMELIGNLPSVSHATVHYGEDFSKHKYKGEQYSILDETFNDRFHIFSVVREKNQMWFYVDDVLFFNFSLKDTQGVAYPFNQKFYFIFNVAIGGNWPGNPDDSTKFPQQMLVDYIRVFEKK